MLGWMCVKAGNQIEFQLCWDAGLKSRVYMVVVMVEEEGWLYKGEVLYKRGLGELR